MIEMKNVSKQFESSKPVIMDVTLTIDQGSLVIFSGLNGSGKTTILSLIAGLVSPTTGRIYINGNDISRLPERFLCSFRREQTGIIFQERHLVPSATVMETVTMPLIPTNIPYRKIREMAMKVLVEYRLYSLEKMKVHTLSGGQKQRLLIARAVINDPEIIIADEPTVNLDKELAAVFAEKLSIWRAQGKTIVMATHDAELIQTIKPDKIFSIEAGRVAETAP